MIPRISFGQLTEDVEKSAYFVKNIANPAPVVDDFPAIPPKLSDVDATAPGDPDEKETWFIVQSPREQGTSGPFSIPQLRRMYKSGEIKNTTLFWAEGESDWQQLMYQRTLKPKLLQLPILPPRVGTYNAERAVYDPVIQAPPIEILDNAEELKGFDITKCCFKCGSMAIAHIPSVTTQIRLPDLFKGRVEIGTTDNTAEILPGLLWIGSAAAAKQRAIVRLGITLLFNCTTNMKGPTSQPPFFRCRDAPMRDQPKHSFTEEEKIELLNMFDRVYDLMEAHRLTPELAAKSDPIPKEYRGPTDKFGLPIKTAADLKVLRRPKDDEKPVFPPRILLWSRLGTDRPCALAAAYIIRQYGITVDHAVHIVRSNHIKTAISSPYMEVLHKWSERYTIGLLICIDCQARVDSTGSTIGDTAFDAEQRTRQATQRRTQRMKTHTEGEEDDSSSDDSDIGFEREGQENEPIPSTNANARLEIDSSLMENSLTESTVELKRIEFEKSLEDGFNTFVQLMKGHMHRMLKDRPHELTVLSRVETYLHKVLTNSVGIKERIPYFRWNGLMDLELSGRHLSDLTMAVLFQLLAGNNLIRQIRMLKLQSNLMASVSAKALLIAYFPEGHMADDTYFFDDSQSVADVDHGFDLMLLDLSNNKIDEFGVPYLQFFLKQCNTLTSLDVSNNKLGDFQCADIFQCFARPPLDFDDGDDTGSFGQYSVAERMKPHNYSITSLNMGLNEPGQNAVEALVNMIKHNAVLRTLVLDLSPGITPLQYKELSLAIRLYNGVLEEISLAENALSVKSVEYIARIFDSKEVAVNKLILTNCSLKYPHMTALMKYILSAQRLTYLDLSGNPIGDKGAAILIEMLSGKVNPLTSKAQPPLAKLDLSSCSMSSQGTAQVLEALAQRTTLTWLDLSHNIIGADNLTAYSALARCSIQDIRLNCCKVCSKGASLIFKSLSDKTTSFSKSVRYIYLSGNEISDSSTASLCLLLENNLTLEGMDLGFNLFTDRDAELMKQATSVHSNSQIEKKLLDFSVNLVGNKCDPYMLETPGMTRAKSTFLYGVQPNSADPVNQGYSHIPHCSRGHFMARKELDNHYREFIPLNPLNSIM